MRRLRIRPLRVAAMIVAVAALAGVGPSASASDLYGSGWRDRHVYYPPRPSGYSGIVSVFGQPCNSSSTSNLMYWVAPDNNVRYAVRYHYKLGGYGSYWGGTGSTARSSNLNNDVRGHIRNDHIGNQVRAGIWGYNCRYIDGTTKWSTHAWGIGVDINSAKEHVGHYHCHTIYGHMAAIWKNHNWYHGVNFGDCMHFQYATSY